MTQFLNWENTDFKAAIISMCKDLNLDIMSEQIRNLIKEVRTIEEEPSGNFSIAIYSIWKKSFTG